MRRGHGCIAWRAFPLLTAAASALHAQDARLASWRLDETPIVTIENEGTAPSDFSRIVGAWRLRDGRIVVANASSSELRIFGPNGRWRQSLGRSGSGPGEFQLLYNVFRSGDTIFTYDGALRRISTFDLSGTPRLVTTLQVTAHGERESYQVIGKVPGGWLARAQSMAGWNDPANVVLRKKDAIGIVGEAGDGTVRWIAEPLGMASFVNSPTGNLQDAAVGPIAFSPWSQAAAAGGGIWFGESGTPEITRYDPTTGRQHAIPLPLAARAPPPELIAASRREEAARTPGRTSSFHDAKWSARFLPKTLPFFSSLTPASDGGIWVRGYAERARVPIPYLVLDRAGIVRARITVPTGVSITDIGDDYVVGIYRDEDELESVRVYRLRRN